ncbi:MAG TPA: nicotinate-nucleotide--dimethylbenzimidazole phosphoribosyltransferase [Bryobacteraceae bacterium]|nr:nicotinate-nucleotide--dimethylbenzimidazole phosphoribosyltransferase [Bryobacteraceae bacterium]
MNLNIQPIDPHWMATAERHQRDLTKPPGSLGRLEAIANRCAAIFGSLTPPVDAARIVIFAADHGVAEEGVSAYPREVTAQMVLNFLNGGAAINALAQAAGIDLAVVDAGVATPLTDAPGLIRHHIADGTRNFTREPAMTEAEMNEALEAGFAEAEAAVADGYSLLGCGEMGIANTTAASAIACALTGRPAMDLTGRGTGADDATLGRKLSAIERALALHGPHLATPKDIMLCLGGFEIAEMTGFFLGAAHHRRPVVVDGFIATAAAALAVRFAPAARDYMFAAHKSAEPGHAALLEIVGDEPLLDLGMRLGEGTGAALAIQLIRSAVAAFTNMATFSSAGVSNKSE